MPLLRQKRRQLPIARCDLGRALLGFQYFIRRRVRKAKLVEFPNAKTQGCWAETLWLPPPHVRVDHCHGDRTATFPQLLLLRKWGWMDGTRSSHWDPGDLCSVGYFGEGFSRNCFLILWDNSPSRWPIEPLHLWLLCRFPLWPLMWRISTNVPLQAEKARV